jgi:hypothetical protein
MIQMIGFSIQPTAGFAWYSPAVSWLQRLSNPLGLSQLADGSNSILITYLALFTVMTLLLNVTFVFYMFSQNRFDQIWTLRLLRLGSGSLSFYPQCYHHESITK